MAKAYDPKTVEASVFQSWVDGGYFRQPVVEGRAPFTVVIPPPNVTGSLHMGHALNNTIQDVLVRRQRMLGRPTRWVVGTDHAGIATQNKVEQKLAKQGLSRGDVGRERFVELCWEWRAEHGGTIISQLKAMGCSCDFDDEHFTMDEPYQAAVRKVFVEWFDEGRIYRGKRIINWCPRCATALSDIEVEHEDIPGHLWYVRYPLAEPVGGVDHVVVATTRPETMLGDTCVAVHPDDERYKALVGATVVLPLVGRRIPIVADAYVDPSFGTGAVKVTPAHDPNDFEIGERHGCAKINIMNADATISEAGGVYVGFDRFAARERVVADLDAAGLLVRVEEHEHAVGHCYRCHTIVEPWLSDQWFVDMKALAEPAIRAVREGKVAFHPQRWATVYFQWMENIRDWCVSRQLWWGHRIPVFYCDACGKVTASQTDLAVCPECGAPVRQDPDVLDTWFSSQLWPFATLGWPETTPELGYFYPTQVLSTARDILFLWVARMIMSGMDFMDGRVPFADVIIHPTVFNAEGKRMSKSLGTGVDPLDLMEDYGADGMRFGLMLQVTGAQDLKFAEEKLLSSRNFANKIWNASRFVLMHIGEDYTPGEPQAATLADRWILSRLAALTADVDAGLDAYEFGETARRLYDFFWDEFCDWYIELAKSRLAQGGAVRLTVQRNLVFVLDKALRLLHPMMPFITEAIWRQLPLPEGERAASLMVAAWPTGLSGMRDEAAERTMAATQELVVAIRALRKQHGVSRKTPLRVTPDGAGTALDAETLALENAAFGEADGTVLGKIVIDGVEHAVSGQVAAAADGALTALRAQADKLAAEAAKRAAKLANEAFLGKAPDAVVAKVRAEAEELAAKLDSVNAQIAALERDE